MGSSLRDELASLRIERSETVRPARNNGPASPGAHRRGGGGLRLLSWLLWLIPLGIVGTAGAVAYRQYDQIRSKPEVTVGLVQKMTTGEAEKLLSAKGYLKAKRQAMIGTKVAGRVEEMRVQEHDEVKKDQILAVIEHYDLDAMIEQRKANLEKSKADLEEAKADLWEKKREANRAERLVAKKMVTQEDFEKASSAQKMCTAKVASLEAMIKVQQANIKEMEYTLKYQMHIMAPFDGTVVEKQGEVGEVINPMAMSSSLGRSAVVTIADLRNIDVETDISENLMSRISARPARRGLRQRGAEQAVQGRAPPDHPHGRPHPGDGEGEGQDHRPRRQALSRARGDGPFPAVQVRLERRCQQVLPVRPEVGRLPGERS